jgi:hypothetical protein
MEVQKILTFSIPVPQKQFLLFLQKEKRYSYTYNEII